MDYDRAVDHPARNTSASSQERPGERLTPRELECLRLLSEGEQAKRIAYILGITRKTAEHYLSDARRKLGGRTATHAVAIAIARGLF